MICHKYKIMLKKTQRSNKIEKYQKWNFQVANYIITV